MHRLVRLHNLERSWTHFSSDIIESVDITVQAGRRVYVLLDVSAKYKCPLRRTVRSVVYREGECIHSFFSAIVLTSSQVYDMKTLISLCRLDLDYGWCIF